MPVTSPASGEGDPQISQIDADGMNRDEQNYQIIEAAMEVHRRLGHGFLEAVFHEALTIEFMVCVPFHRGVIRRFRRLTQME